MIINLKSLANGDRMLMAKSNIKLLAQYNNGNYTVYLYSDGTKIRETDDNIFKPTFPESIDLKITNYCDRGCPMCHEESSLKGRHGDINKAFINTLPKGIEIAIGGGNPLAHPHLLDLLLMLNQKGIIANMTVNEYHFLKYQSLLEKYLRLGLIKGLGISLWLYDNATIEFASHHKTVILHTILGILEYKQIELLKDKELNILLLGYKNFGRGKEYYLTHNINIEKNIEEISKDILNLKDHFRTISMDNLALKQLDIISKISNEEYKRFYMGEEGEYTMYIDLVKEEYAVNSTSINRYPLEDNIINMFKKIGENKQ